MSKNYNVPEIDNVLLNDYCSKDYLDENFINIINNFWKQSSVNFYIKDIIEEDELDNLSKYYNYSPSDSVIYPNCEDIINYKKNPLKFRESVSSDNIIQYFHFLMRRISLV